MQKNQLCVSEIDEIVKMQELISNCQYKEFFQFAQQIIHTSADEEVLGRLYLTRAQVKLMLLDATLLNDIKMARKYLKDRNNVLDFSKYFPTLSPSLFIISSPNPGAFSHYKLAIEKARPAFRRYCGSGSVDLIDLYEAELFYMRGHLERAVNQTKPIYRRAMADNDGYLVQIAGFTLLRCYIAQGLLGEIQEVMATIYRFTKGASNPHNRILHRSIKHWLNCTTGWLGETPRYYKTPDGKAQPILEDRIQAINEGVVLQDMIEAELMQAAIYLDPNSYTLKGLYMGIFEAMLQFKLGKRDQATETFVKMYESTHKNRIMMPFVEYGEQILPLLQYAISQKNGHPIARRWSDKLKQMATQYEACLRLIRGEATPGSSLREPLSNLEIQVLELMVQEMTITEIADSLERSTEEIKHHFRRIYRKLQVHNRYEAVAKAVGGHILSFTQ